MGKVFAWMFGFVTGTVSGIVSGIVLFAVCMLNDPDRFIASLEYNKTH